MKTALLIEDSLDSRLLMARALPDFHVLEAPSIQDAEKILRDNSKIDLVLLDIDLPDGDGLRFFSVLRSHPEWGNIPTFVVSAHASLPNKITAFSLGADDFVPKPFDLAELRVRVEARLRKADASRAQADTFRFGDVELDFPSQSVRLFKPEKPRPDLVELTSKEFRILSYLLKRKGAYCSREELLEEVWGAGVNVIDRTVDTHISHIRRKILGSRVGIEASPGMGYRAIEREPS